LWRTALEAEMHTGKHSVLVMVFALIFFQPHAEAAQLLGLVTDASSGAPVEGAEVLLAPLTDGNPAPGTVSTNSYGLFALSDVQAAECDVLVSAPGYEPSATLSEVFDGQPSVVTVQLEPAGGLTLFSVDVQVFGIRSGVNLQGASVTMNRWMKPDGNGPAEDVAQATTDEMGRVRFEGTAAGYFRFAVLKLAWNPLEYPAVGSGPTPIDAGHSGVAALKAVGQPLTVVVTGHDPVTEEDGPIEGAFVDITGIDPFDGKEVINTRTRITGADGTVVFHDLDPIPWRVDVRKLGYNPYGAQHMPDALGKFSQGNVKLKIH